MLDFKTHHVRLNSQLLSESDRNLFDTAAESSTTSNQLGRGTAYFFQYNHLNLVIRQYRRGGLLRKLLNHHYFYVTLAKTRMWREYELLDTLHQQGLPVPQPIGARCSKTSPLTYKGEIVTQAIENSQTLAERLVLRPISNALWATLGELLAQFHHQGVYHADLNANNIMITEADAFFLIDFDRGRIRAPSKRWQNNNIRRLLRSLHKLQNLAKGDFHFHQNNWQSLLSAYTNYQP